MGPKPAPKAKPKAAAPAKQSELQKLIKKKKDTEKQLALANAQLVAKRNKEMLDEEDEEEEDEPPKKKTRPSKTSTAPDSDEFAEDDVAGLDGLLGSDLVSTADERTSDAESEPHRNGADDEEEEEEEAEDDTLPVMPDEEMITEEPVAKAKKINNRRASGKGKSARISQSTFSPASTRLANAGRRAVRVKIATDTGFPSDHPEFAWTAVSDAVASSEVPELIKTLSIAEKSEERRAQLLTYAWGGAPQLRGEVKTLCKSAVALYGIPGDFTPEEIVKHIAWLTGKKGIFKYGGIDLVTHTYDVQLPYGHPFYKNVMTKQWFDTPKSEGVRTSSFRAFVDSPVPCLNLVTNGMLNSLKEWATGVRIQIKFTEEEFGPSYERTRAALLNLQEKSPTWFGQFQRSLYSKIVSTSNFPHLRKVVEDTEEGELDGVDFDALEASATSKNDAVLTDETAPSAVPAS